MNVKFSRDAKLRKAVLNASLLNFLSSVMKLNAACMRRMRKSNPFGKSTQGIFIFS